MARAQPVPDGMHTVTAHLVMDGAARAIEFYEKAFGAEELARHPAPDGERLMHAAIRIGDTVLMLADDFPEWGQPARNPKALGGSSVTLHLYVPDCDQMFQRAVAAGASVKMPLADMFWGDRYGVVTDPFGHDWSIATHQHDLSPQELEEAAKQAFA